MAEREQIKRPAPTPQEAAVDETQATAASTVHGEKLKAEMDDILDEIDTVLESNAEEFVRSYVQKGGQ